MDDEDTLDEPEELLEQARKAVAKNQVSDEEPAGVDDETIPAKQDASAVAGLDDETVPAKQDASAVAGLDDETIPADKGTFSPLAGLDDETIDVDPELIRRLGEQRAEQQPADQSTDPDQTIARGSHDPPPNYTAGKRKRRWAIGIPAVAVVAAGVVALALLVNGEDKESLVGPTSVPTTEATVAPTVTSVPTTEATVAPTVTSVPTTEATVAPTVTSVPTTEATVAPTVTSVPTTEATVAPTVTSVPTTEATVAPTVTSVPTTEPTVTSLPTQEATATSVDILPGEGFSVLMARADWSTGYFQSHLYKQLLEELGYSVSEPSELELGPSLAYLRMSQGDVDFWVNSWYPGHVYWWAPELPDGSTVGDHLSIVGNEMVAGGAQGFLITKSFADEHGVTHLDQLNDDPAILAAFDTNDQSPGNGVADIYGCTDSWTCDNIIDSQIAFSDWTNIAQVKAGYDAMFAEATVKANAGEPMVIYTWTPSAYITQLRPGDNVVWLAVEEVIDDSNPTGLEGGEGHDQRPGQANIGPEFCPAAADAGTCQLGWVANNIQVTANTEWLNANPYAAELLCQVSLSVFDVSDANATGSFATEDFIAGQAADWIADNRALVDGWLEAARMPPMEPTCPDTIIPLEMQ